MQRKSKAEIKKMLEEMRKPAQEGPARRSHNDGPHVGKEGAKTAKRGGTYRPKI